MKCNTGLKWINPKPTGFHELSEVVPYSDFSLKFVDIKITQISFETIRCGVLLLAYRLWVKFS